MKRYTMRQHAISTSLVVGLLISILCAPLISANNSTISSDTNWSGTIILDSDIIVSSGSTLTIEPNTIVDGGDGFAIEVYGTLVAESSYFFSSAQPTAQSSHGQGLWQGLVIKSGGSATITDVEIQNTNVGIKSEGTLIVDNLTVIDSYLGVKNYGTANIEEFHAESIDYEGIMNSGNLVLSLANISNASSGIQSSGTLEVTNSNFSQVGTVIGANSGEVFADNLGLKDVSVGLSSVAGVKFSASNISGVDVSLLIDMANSDDFVVSSVEVSGDILAKSNDASQTKISDVEFIVTNSGQTPVVEQSCIGTCIIENIVMDNSAKGISFTGNGHHMLTNSTINAEQYGIRSANQASLFVDNVTVNSQHNGIIIRDSNSHFHGENTIEMSGTSAIGLDILGGTHQFENMRIAKAYDNGDTTSIGAQFWYTDISLQNLTTENYSTGLTMRDVNLSASFVANIGGNSIGTEIIDSYASIHSISTQYQDSGVILRENAQLSTYQWVAQLHDQPLQVGIASVVYALDFTTVNTNPSYSDASGQGTLYYGENQNLDISCDNSDYFVMTNVKFTDMSNNPVEALINVNTFEFESNENGEVYLPLISQGSIVVATVSGTGVNQVLLGGIQDQVVQIPVIPDGDWIISGIQSISLESIVGARTLNGNLVIEDNAVLRLTNLDLVLASGNSIVLRDNAQIIAINASLDADVIFVNDSALISGNDASHHLEINAAVQWNCFDLTNTNNLFFSGALNLGPGCHLAVENAEANGELTIPNDSSFTIISSLTVSVVDRGVPVSGAIIEFKSADYYTDNSGEVVIKSTARLVDSNGDVLGSNENILLKFDNFNELITWNTSSSKIHQFIVSSLDTNDILAGDVTLESRWSPYYLEQDLTIPIGKTLSIMDGVAVRISDGVAITIFGTLEASSAVLSSTGLGDRWSGLVMESQYANLFLDQTTLLEASPSIMFSGGNLVVDGGTISRSASSRALIEVNEQVGGSFSLSNMRLTDGSGSCIDIIESTIQLYISNVEFYACNGPSIRAENANVAIDNVVIGEGSSDGLVLSSISGTIENIDALEFNGAGNILKLDYINNDLSISNIVGTVGGSPGIAGSNNRALNIDLINLTGAPAIDFDYSSGIISDITLAGNGFGTAIISHHGRYSDSLRLHGLDITNYAVGIDLHADGPDTASPLTVNNAIISASTSLSIEDYPMQITNADITGDAEISGAINVDFIDSQVTPQVSIYDGASVSFYQTIEFLANYLDILKPTKFDISVMYSNGTTDIFQIEDTMGELAVKLATRYAQPSFDVTLQSIEIIAASVGHPIESMTMTYNQLTQLDSPIVFTLRDNQAPEINSVSPTEFDTIMQSIPFVSTIDATDDYDSSSQLNYHWIITDNTGSEVYTASLGNDTNLITLVLPGSYLLKVVVTDSFQAQSEMIIPIEVELLDSDGDYILTCDDTTWFDLSASRSCGPDVYDNDDDNDGIIDSRDEWPLDPCAWQDTDGDGQPDNLNCPEGVNSDLFEDQDDDGDGIPDTLEGSTSNSEGSFNSVTLILLVVGIIVVVVFLRRTRQGLQE